MTSNFSLELNRNMVEALNNNAAFIIQPQEIQVPIINNSLTGIPITGANYINLMCVNALNTTRHTEYVKMNEALDSNPEWFSTLRTENRPRGTLYQEDAPSQNLRYSFVVPTAELNQNMYRDNLNNERPRDNYIPYQSNNVDMSNFGAFVQEQFTNAINASFTHCAYKSNIPPEDLEKFRTHLIGEITKNPNFMSETSGRAYQEVMDYHYLPYDRKSFIERARDENSNEFKQLNSTITNHVEDMAAHNKPSFNPEFTELSKPLVENIKNIRANNPDSKPAVENEITDFLKEQIKRDRPAVIIADTCAGTCIEKSEKLEKIGKYIIKGVALAGALFTANYPAAAGIAGSLLSDILAKRKKTPEVSPEEPKIVIDKKEVKQNELEKILDFDNGPFSFYGKGKVTKQDYEMARKVEEKLLEKYPAINKDEYNRDMTQKQASDFVKKTAEKTGDISPEKIAKVVENIVSIQQMKGDNTLRCYQDNPRAFYSGLNKTIKDNPQVLEQAVSQVNNVKNSLTKAVSMGRK